MVDHTIVGDLPFCFWDDNNCFFVAKKKYPYAATAA